MHQTTCSGLAVVAVVVFMNGCFGSGKEQQAKYAFGAIADCQYCAVEGTGVRKYPLSKNKLEQCVAHFNTMDLQFVVHLGDFIDREFSNFDVLNPIYGMLNAPGYHVLGNHDFSVSDELKDDVPAKMGLPAKYYDFAVQGWRYVVLDGNDISFHAYPADSAGHKKATEFYETNKVTSPRWNGAIGPEQLSWLKSVLESAAENSENVIIFCHFPVYPENVHNLWNSGEIIAILESYSCVKAYINGHNHKGGYAMKNGIHYLTLKGMVDTEQTSYAVIRVDDKHIQVAGHGREADRMMLIRNEGN